MARFPPSVHSMTPPSFLDALRAIQPALVILSIIRIISRLLLSIIAKGLTARFTTTHHHRHFLPARKCAGQNHGVGCSQPLVAPPPSRLPRIAAGGLGSSVAPNPIASVRVELAFLRQRGFAAIVSLIPTHGIKHELPIGC